MNEERVGEMVSKEIDKVDEILPDPEESNALSATEIVTVQLHLLVEVDCCIDRTRGCSKVI